MHWYWEMVPGIVLLVYMFVAAIAWQLVYRLAAWRLTGIFTGGWVENQVLWGMTIAAAGLPIAFCMKDWRDPLLVIIRSAINGENPAGGARSGNSEKYCLAVRQALEILKQMRFLTRRLSPDAAPR